MARISTEAMVESFHTYRQEVMNTLGSVADQLARGDYVRASQTMNALTRRQAATSLAMRTVLIRNGLMGEHDDDE